MPPITEAQLCTMLAEVSRRGLAPPYVPAYFQSAPQPALAELGVGPLTGKTFLDVGSNIGLRCFQAAQDGAAHVVGVDVNPDRVDQARALASMLGLDAEFRCLDADEQLPDVPADVVVCSNVLNRSVAPAALLRKLSALTIEQLVLYTGGPDSPEFANLLKKSGLTSWHMRWLGRSPIVLVGRAGPTVRAPESRFAFTPQAVRQLLLHHNARFSNVTVQPAALRGYYNVTATRRRLGHVLVISGISGVGKTTFLKRMQELPEEAERILGIRDFAAWPVIEPVLHAELTDAQIPRLCLHNDLGRGLRYPGRTLENDAALQLLQDAERVTCVTLWAPLNVLQERKRARLIAAAPDSARSADEPLWSRLTQPIRRLTSARRFRGARAARWRAQQEWDEGILRHPELIQQQYRRWIRFCEHIQVDAHWIVDTSKPIEPIDVKQFDKLR